MSTFEPLKNSLGPRLVEQLARRFHDVYPPFRHRAFVKRLAAELEPLELKGRIIAIAAALRDHLPEDYPEALDIVVRALGGEIGSEDGIFNSGWYVFPLAQFVEDYGLEHPDRSLAALHEITRRSTAEFAIRPYILRYPKKTLALLRRWAKEPNEHVRRLVSEGTRPRLPWGARLKPFIDDPAPVLDLLELLKDDPSLYVRRSVANNLNDIGKDHPELLLETVRRWSIDASEERMWIIRHALRNMVKQGDRGALELLGFGGPDVTLRDFRLAPSSMRMHDVLDFSFTLESGASTSQRLVVDYVIYFVKASGGRAPKVFKLKNCVIDGNGILTLNKRHPIRPITTRRYYPGTHHLEIQVNGKIVGGGEFELVME